MFIGFRSLDLFANFGILSAGDTNAETSLAHFLNDPKVNEKVDYLFVGQGTEEAKGFMGRRCLVLHEALEKHKIEHEYYTGGSWRSRLVYLAAPAILSVSAQPLAEQIAQTDQADIGSVIIAESLNVVHYYFSWIKITIGKEWVK